MAFCHRRKCIDAYLSQLAVALNEGFCPLAVRYFPLVDSTFIVQFNRFQGSLKKTMHLSK